MKTGLSIKSSNIATRQLTCPISRFRCLEWGNMARRIITTCPIDSNSWDPLSILLLALFTSVSSGKYWASWTNVHSAPTSWCFYFRLCVVFKIKHISTETGSSQLSWPRADPAAWKDTLITGALSTSPPLPTPHPASLHLVCMLRATTRVEQGEEKLRGVR